MKTPEFKHKAVIYIAGFATLGLPMYFTALAQTVAGISGYLAALTATLPIWIAGAAQLMMMHAVFEDSFEHDMDEDWWMAVFFLGPAGLLMYYFAREEHI